jgi:hypothetical protein
MTLLVSCLGLIASGHGQSMPDWLSRNGSLKPPDFGILDKGTFFGKESGSFKRISDQLRKLEADRGYKIYLVIEPVLIGTNANQLAAELRQAWLPRGDGLVIVFETDTRSLGIGCDLNILPEAHGDTETIPTHEAAALIRKVRDTTDSALAPEAYVEAVVGNIVTECEGYFARREAPPPAGRSLKLSFLVIGAVALLGLGAIGMGWVVRHSTMGELKQFYFPSVDLPERLGAPCGGSVTSRPFRSTPASHS